MKITEILNTPIRTQFGEPREMSAGGRRAGQLAVDWTRMASRISEEGRARFNQLRNRYETCKVG